MRKQVAAAAEWTRVERERLRWSTAELASKADQMASDMGWEGSVPTEAGIEALEAQLLKSLPRWFKLVRYSVERADISDADALSWLAERNFYWQTTDPLKMTRPLLFEDEYRFINTLQKLDESDRRAVRAFVTDYADRQCYASKEEYARRFLKRLGIHCILVEDSERGTNQCHGLKGS